MAEKGTKVVCNFKQLVYGNVLFYITNINTHFLQETTATVLLMTTNTTH